ncbi:putative Polyneuridine-aldehyde esterase precursor [Corchorus olitorius]|uniref:Polyneuridine-aldehyde esterase n=1 Tax=Corchorus olitorius TaxID=93759 RepID=A0A1R3K505_9ROSI|nr:putative Polyneuridine-aldehyde esterase precursor [Corchorus olitorius]
MAGSGIHPKQVHEILSMSDYLEPLMELMASLPSEERVILVGHSKGGLCISAAMERFPDKVSVGVFATAFMFGPNLTSETVIQQFNEGLDSEGYMDTQYGFHNGQDKPTSSFLFGPNLLASKLYQLSPPEDLTLALSLVRPVGVCKDEESNKAMAVTKEKYGSVRRVYIVCNEDKILTEDFQRWMIANNPPDEVKLIPDSDHMPMFSKPYELCSCLEEIAEKYH